MSQWELDTCEEELRLNPYSVALWTNKCYILMKMGRNQESLAASEQAIRLDPSNAQAWSTKGGALGNMGRYQESLAASEQAIRLNSSIAQAWSNKGGALFYLQRFDEALAACETAIHLDSGTIDAWNNKVGCLSSLRRYREALATCDEAARLGLSHPALQHNRDIALDNLKMEQQGKGSLNSSIDSLTNSLSNYLNKVEYDLKEYERLTAPSLGFIPKNIPRTLKQDFLYACEKRLNSITAEIQTMHQVLNDGKIDPSLYIYEVSQLQGRVRILQGRIQRIFENDKSLGVKELLSTLSTLANLISKFM